MDYLWDKAAHLKDQCASTVMMQKSVTTRSLSTDHPQDSAWDPCQLFTCLMCNDKRVAFSMAAIHCALLTCPLR